MTYRSTGLSTKSGTLEPKVSSLLGLSRLARPHVGPLVASTLLLALHALTTGAYAYLVGPLLKFIYSGGESAGSGMSQTLIWIGWEPNSDPTRLTTFIALVVVALVVVKGIAYFGGTYLVMATGQRLEHSLRTTLYGHLLLIEFKKLSEIPRGDLVSRFISDVAAMKFAVTHGLTTMVRDTLQIIVLAVLAVSLDPLLGVIALCVLPVSSVVIVRIGKRLRKRRRAAFDAYGEIGSTTEQTSAALPVIRAFGAEEHARTHFSSLSAKVLKRNVRAWALQIFSSPLMELLGAIALSGTLWYAGSRIRSGALEPEEFVSFFAAVFLMYRPIKAMGEAVGNISNGLAALDRLDTILALPTEPPDPPDSISIDAIERNVRFDDVSFFYDESEPLLEGASFTIGAGETVALVGPSGSGKTTIAMLLLRFVDPRAGHITIDDQHVSKIDRSSIRALFAFVNQDPVLLHDTIEANLTFGLEATREDIEKASTAAGAHEFVTALSHGYETSVGQSGTRLSGGERQRLCIARAILREPPALILDEATAAVDSATEAEITASLERLMKGRTTLLISHRLSTVRRAHQILVLDGGRIVDQGTYDELAERSEPFRRIFADQLSSSDD